ncbi:phosphatase PAP2 family protein [Pseudochrobactrum sp. HB0163]|uniref:phosphatase PAP2 family protein n=1 Tax=Pseudochrobactrum sp. HB0163 TaxID=3450708 RepID=UPI003F6DE3D4
MILPVADLVVSGWFTDSAGNFYLHNNQNLLALRDLHRILPALIIPALLLTLMIQAFFSRCWLPAPHKLLYILSVYTIGAVAVVHSLKFLVGRARPNEIAEFGGELLFTPAWQIAHICHKNCSFPSGEAASAMAMLAVPLAIGGIYRTPLLLITAVAAFAFSLNRVAMGAHFLSDIVLSWLFVALVMAWLWPVFHSHKAGIDHFVFKAGRRICACFSSLR